MAKHSTQPEVDASQLVFHTKGLSEDEIAAVTAVLTSALREQAAAQQPTADADSNAWQRSLRGLRQPLVRGPGAWRSWG
ncbi:acyl-CoA carboxylase subunit epsilon [Humibacter sp.]|uniref:acyl-CoA carboxylase subunit epsilon n=1 Tax=Humibacter sp. TaxID=1940291 RepID=UPI003F813BBC